MSDELKPCPFCGVVPVRHDGGMLSTCAHAVSRANIVADWNKRPTEDALRAELVGAKSDYAQMKQLFDAAYDACVALRDGNTALLEETTQPNGHVVDANKGARANSLLAQSLTEQNQTLRAQLAQAIKERDDWCDLARCMSEHLDPAHDSGHTCTKYFDEVYECRCEQPYRVELLNKMQEMLEQKTKEGK